MRAYERELAKDTLARARTPKWCQWERNNGNGKWPQKGGLLGISCK